MARASAAVCLVVPPSWPVGHLPALADGLADADVELHVPSLPAPSRPESADLGLAVRSAGAALRETWSADAPDVVHTVDAVHGLAALTAAPPGTRLVHSTLGRLSASRAGTRSRPSPDVRMEAALVRRVDAVIAGSSRELDQLRRLGVPPDRLSLVPVGVDTAAYADSGPTAPRAAPRRVVTLTRTLLDGAAEVVRALRGLDGVEVVVASAAPSDAPREAAGAQRLRTLAGPAVAGPGPTLVQGTSAADLPPLLRSADVVVLAPAYSNGGGAVRAMSCGRPVVATAVGGCADAVVPRTTGLLVDPDDPVALRRATRELLESEVLREGYGIAGRLRAEARYTWAHVAELLATAYLPDRDVDLGPMPRRRSRRRRPTEAAVAAAS